MTKGETMPRVLKNDMAANLRDRKMQIRDWLAQHEHLLGSPYEKLFVEKVLQAVSELDFSAVHAQFAFKDADNKQRYCDFVLIEGSDIRIAIEVDGYDKRGTGTGMTKEEFLDWQRRQAALTSQGWFVLRFANTDVRDQPQRCKDHIELLLRRERLKRQHQESLRSAISDLTDKLASVEQGGKGSSAEAEKKRLQDELVSLKAQLQLARDARPLDTQERALLEKYESAQKQIEVLTTENRTMKTTVWAFAFIIAVMIVTFGFRQTGGLDQQAAAPTQAPVAASNARAAQPTESPQTSVSTGGDRSVKRGDSCENPLDWREARQHVGARVAIAGQVARVTYRQDVQGQPTWIEIGAAFPNPDRVTLVVWGNNRDALGPHISRMNTTQKVCVIGTVERYRESHQLELREGSQVRFF